MSKWCRRASGIVMPRGYGDAGMRAGPRRHFSMLVNSHLSAVGGGPSLPVAGATLWVDCGVGLYESDDTSDPCEAGDFIRRWVDLSGEGNDLLRTGTSAFNPSWDSATLHRGRNTVRFQAAGFQRLILPDMFDGLSAGEIFFTVKMLLDPPVNSNRAGFHSIIGDGASATHHPWTDSVCYDSTLTTVRKTVGNLTPALTDWHVWSVRSAAGDWEAYHDNTSVHATGTNTFGAPASTSNLGCNSVVDLFADMWVAELVFYPFTLDATQRTDTVDYLTNG